MTRPTILDLDDVAVVPVEPTPEMENAFNRDFRDWLDERIEDQWHLWRAMLSASPHSSAWDDMRKYVEGLERKEARSTASLTGLLDALEHHTGERHGIMAIRHLVDRAEAAEARIAELERRLADAERVIEPFAAVEPMNVWHETGDDEGYHSLTENQFRAARAYMEGK